MTREEAIMYWEDFLGEIDQMEVDDCWTNEDAETQREATKMAISALRQQETVTERHELTNAQRIRAMSDEELAEVLSAPCLGCVVKNCRLHNYGSGGCTIAFLKWLQQPAEEG